MPAAGAGHVQQTSTSCVHAYRSQIKTVWGLAGLKMLILLLVLNWKRCGVKVFPGALIFVLFLSVTAVVLTEGSRWSQF